MNIYVETNFILELALLQKENEFCKELLEVCKKGNAKLVMPAFSIAEPYETLNRRWKDRRQLSEKLLTEISQLSRTSSYTDKIELGKQINKFLIQTIEDEELRINNAFDQLLNVIEIIPFDMEIITLAASHRKTKSLSSQDSIVYASIIKHLENSSSGKNCLINKNSSDFDDPDIITELDKYNCKVLFKFKDGLGYIKASLGMT